MDNVKAWPVLPHGTTIKDVAQTRDQIGLGKVVFFFNENNRVYQYGEDGRALGGPVYRHYYVAVKIASETSRSWVSLYGNKIPKNDLKSVFGLQDVEDQIWIASTRYLLADAVKRCGDIAALKQIASLLSFEETK